MGLFNKVKDTDALKRERLELSDILKYRKQNTKKIKKFLNTIDADINDIKSHPFAQAYIEIINNDTFVEQQEITAITNDRAYASSLAYFKECEKWCALYYLNADNGKLPEQRLAVIEDLLWIYDMMMHATLKHFNLVRKEPMCWKDFTLYTRPDVKDVHIINYITKCTDNISNLIDAIDNCDNTRVYKTYEEIYNTQMQASIIDPFAEYN